MTKTSPIVRVLCSLILLYGASAFCGPVSTVGITSRSLTGFHVSNRIVNCNQKLIVLQQSSSTDATAKTITQAPTPPISRSDRKKRVATGMAFLTGWADVMLVTKYQTFATMMTGNLMKLATATIECNLLDVGYFSSVIVSYIFGMAMFRRLDLTYRKKTLRVCGLVVAALFIGSDFLYAQTKSRFLPVVMLASGFGIINSIGSEVAGTLTFVVTGHMTRLTNLFVDRLSRQRGRKELVDKDWDGVKQNSGVIGGFFVGALFAVLMKSKITNFAAGAFAAMGVLYGMLFSCIDMESLGGAWWKRKDNAMCDDVDNDGTICDLPDDLPDPAAEMAKINNTTDKSL